MFCGEINRSNNHSFEWHSIASRFERVWAFKSCNISETQQDRTEVTIED